MTISTETRDHYQHISQTQQNNY